MLKLFFKDGYKVDAGNVVAVNDMDPMSATSKIINMVNDEKVGLSFVNHLQLMFLLIILIIYKRG